jgi:hypothetical protein
MHRRKGRLLPREFLVEVARVGGVSDGGEVRRGNTLVVDVVEIDILEEKMALDLLGVRLACAKTAGGVAGEQLRRSVNDGGNLKKPSLVAGGKQRHGAW